MFRRFKSFLVTLVSSQTIMSASVRIFFALSDISPVLPMGVATTYKPVIFFCFTLTFF